MSARAPNLESSSHPVRAAAAGRLALQSLLLVFAGFFVYTPVLHGGWLWDDTVAIVMNPVMHGFSGLWKFWFDPPGPDYFPVTSSIEWLLWRGFGNNTLPFHLAGLGLHLMSAFLLWRLFARLGLRLAWLGALLFVVHPLAVESVAWISELKNTVSLPLFLLSLLAFVNYDERRRPSDFLVSLVFFMASLLAKTSVVMLPFVLLLYFWWKYGRIKREDAIVCLPFFAVAVVMGVITVCFQREWAIGNDQIDTDGFAGRIAGAGWAVIFYFSKSVLPIGLIPMYPQWSFAKLSLGDFLPWLLIGVVFALFILRRRSWGRPALLGCGFFVINLAPVLGFITMSYMGIAWVADHFDYLPMVGLIGLAAGSADAVLRELPKSYRLPASCAAAALAFIFAWQGRIYAENFRDSNTLWAYTLEQNPGSFMAATNLAGALSELGRLPESETFFRKSLEINPDYYGTHSAFADTLAKIGKLPEAEKHYLVAWRHSPDSLAININLANVLLREKKIYEALQYYALALHFHPDSVEARYDLANVLVALGRSEEALNNYETVLKLQPDFKPARDAIEKLRAASPPTTENKDSAKP